MYRLSGLYLHCAMSIRRSTQIETFGYDNIAFLKNTFSSKLTSREITYRSAHPITCSDKSKPFTNNSQMTGTYVGCITVILT